MYSVVRGGGFLYIRDILRPDKKLWPLFLERIGEARWANEELVRDYVGATAGALRTEELEQILNELGLEYTIDSGNYALNQAVLDKSSEAGEIEEFEAIFEFVCIVRKPVEPDDDSIAANLVRLGISVF